MQTLKVTKRSIANNIFAELLPQREVLGNKRFRRTVIENIMERNEVEHTVAATAYNHAKKQAVHVGLTTDFARSAALTAAQEPVRGENDNWSVVNKESDQVVGYYTSRNKARAVKQEDEVVRKL